MCIRDSNDSSTNTGQPYCRIGAMCQIDLSQSEDWDAHSCTGGAKIKGLPFNTLHPASGSTYLHRYVTEQGYTLAMHHGGTTDEISPYWCRTGTNNLQFTFEHMAAWGAFDNYLGLSYITV